MPKKDANPIDRHVVTRIRMQRMVRGLSQTELGEAVGVTFQQVQKYEKCKNWVSASRLQQIADVLKGCAKISSLRKRIQKRPETRLKRRNHH